MTGVKEEPEHSLPAWLGYWPAAGGLAAFVWLELVYQDAAKPVTVLIFLLLYGLVQLIGASYFGMRWYERCDGFEVYSTLVGRLCPFGRRDDGGSWCATRSGVLPGSSLGPASSPWLPCCSARLGSTA